MISRNSIKGPSDPSKESNHKQWAASRNNMHTYPSSELSFLPNLIICVPKCVSRDLREQGPCFVIL